jgi:hypothetical protein
MSINWTTYDRQRADFVSLRLPLGRSWQTVTGIAAEP